MKKLNRTLAAAVALLVGTVSSHAIDITAGATVSEAFAIGTATTAALPTDWKADKKTTERTIGTYAAAVAATEQRAGTNMSSTASNGIYNYGAGNVTTATERAVGFISSSSATKSGNLYAKLVNTGGSPIATLTLSYNVEKYRKGSNAAGFAIQMYHSTDGVAWTSAGADFRTAFTADADNNGYATAPGATTSVSAKTLPVGIAAGGTLYLAWNYSVATGSTTSNAQGLGVDDVSITANAAGGNTAPVLTVTPPTANVFTGQGVTTTASATDADNDIVDLSVSSTDILDVGTYFNAGTGVFAWTPTTGGTYVVTFTADDGNEGIDTETFTITAAVPVPVLTVTPTTTNVVAGIQVTATASATDPDSDVVTLSVASAQIPDVASYFNAATGAFAWTPTAAGTYTVTFSATDNDGTVTKTLTVTVSLAAPVLGAPTNITGSSFDVAWAAVTGATGYLLDVTSVTGDVTPVLTENFTGFSGGSAYPNAGSINVAASLDTYTTTPGWTGASVYQAQGMVKMGVSGGLGWIETPAMDLSGHGGVFTMAFDAGAWSSDIVNKTIDVVIDGTVTNSVTLSNTAMQSFTVSGTGGTATSKIRFSARLASNNRFFLDNLKIVSGSGTFQTVLTAEPVAGTSYHLSGLTGARTYTVTARATDGVVTSGSSNAVSASTPDTAPTATIAPLQYTVTEGDVVSFLVTTFDAEGHTVGLDMDLLGATVTETATTGVFQFSWTATGTGPRSVTFTAHANGLDSAPVVVSITVNPAGPVNPIAPSVGGVALTPDSAVVTFSVSPALEAGVTYTLWIADAPGGPWSFYPQTQLQVLNATTASFTDMAPSPSARFYRVQATR